MSVRYLLLWQPGQCSYDKMLNNKNMLLQIYGVNTYLSFDTKTNRPTDRHKYTDTETKTQRNSTQTHHTLKHAASPPPFLPSHTHTHTHACTHARTHARTHTHTHTHNGNFILCVTYLFWVLCYYEFSEKNQINLEW